VLSILQEPEPGRSYHCYRGDTFTFTLRVPADLSGSAFLRINVGHAATTRQETIDAVLFQHPPLSRDWYDVPMRATAPGVFEIKIPLLETGHFEAKCYYLPDNAHQPLWPQGKNVVLNISPADTCGANIIYNAFVRQFGPGKEHGLQLTDDQQHLVGDLDQSGYAVIPPSGTFATLSLNSILSFITWGAATSS